MGRANKTTPTNSVSRTSINPVELTEKYDSKLDKAKAEFAATAKPALEASGWDVSYLEDEDFSIDRLRGDLRGMHLMSSMDASRLYRQMKEMNTLNDERKHYERAVAINLKRDAAPYISQVTDLGIDNPEGVTEEVIRFIYFSEGEFRVKQFRKNFKADQKTKENLIGIFENYNV